MNVQAIIAHAKREFESSSAFKSGRAALLAAALINAIQKAAQIDDTVTAATLR